MRRPRSPRKARDPKAEAAYPRTVKIGLEPAPERDCGRPAESQRKRDAREAIARAERDGHDLTDEASAIEWLGHAPRLVQGSLRNFKVTYPEDFALAEAILKHVPGA